MQREKPIQTQALDFQDGSKLAVPAITTDVREAPPSNSPEKLKKRIQAALQPERSFEQVQTAAEQATREALQHLKFLFENWSEIPGLLNKTELETETFRSQYDWWRQMVAALGPIIENLQEKQMELKNQPSSAEIAEILRKVKRTLSVATGALSQMTKEELDLVKNTGHIERSWLGKILYAAYSVLDYYGIKTSVTLTSINCEFDKDAPLIPYWSNQREK